MVDKSINELRVVFWSIGVLLVVITLVSMFSDNVASGLQNSIGRINMLSVFLSLGLPHDLSLVLFYILVFSAFLILLVLSIIRLAKNSRYKNVFILCLFFMVFPFLGVLPFYVLPQYLAFHLSRAFAVIMPIVLIASIPITLTFFIKAGKKDNVSFE